ncbi:MAG: acyl-CoA dehydrogenase [Balneolaceae bacterium]|nr:acyl-CoA dehydrogenase [Balneolaceae bacterium]MBO6547875.1 acyl-CoA dehydrogenase [Balneolaceae bacterium]MBO6648388.1 acyl-CoA dehydrogenase [Balneolaceae bacterium]
MEAITELFGFLYEAPLWASIGAAIILVVGFAYTGAPLWLWAIAGYLGLAGLEASNWIFITYTVLVVLFNIKPVRRNLLSAPIMKLLDVLNFLPTISETEQTAIDAGTVWVEGELFSGKPNFKRILDEPYPELTTDEQSFLDNQVEALCGMVNDWDVFVKKDFNEDAWEYMRKEGFFGLIIPKKFGGHEFSATAHSAIVAKLGSRCGPLATTVMVPNSLGPAELLMHYGTDKQKEYYLPRLAAGVEMPCFALTEPNAGSDAGGMTSHGEVFKGEDGKLYLKLNWNKRYITLAAISTVLGLAFKLYDPENLLGKGEDLGITCALIPSDTKGVEIGKRHDPLGVPFYNCPTHGHDVVVPIDAIIGGKEGAGNGWRMLMESLAVGRGISLPAQSLGGAKMATRVVGAYAMIRKQFGLNIGKFEGIEEPMARIGGYTYFMEAARKYTTGGLDKGAKPAVVTAIMKYNFTELMREVINDGMDIVGGAGISRGPRNIFANGYISLPIAITVEGANILTRTLMIFGQGAIRCHPYALNEIKALTEGDAKAFDENFWAHIGHVGRNKARAFMLSITRGRLASSPVSGPASRYFKKLAWASASFAFFADIALGSYGGALKMKEKIAGRYADVLSHMYLAAATLRRFEAEGRRKEDEAYFKWSMDYIFFRMQEAFEGILREIKVPGLTWVFRLAGVWSRMNPIGTYPSDYLGHKVASAMQTVGEQRDRITEGTYIPKDPTEAIGRYEHTLNLITEAAPVYKKMYVAMKKREIPKAPVPDLIDPALEKGVITKEEAELARKAEDARYDAIQVDEFTQEEYMNETTRAPRGNGLPSEEVAEQV